MAKPGALTGYRPADGASPEAGAISTLTGFYPGANMTKTHNPMPDKKNPEEKDSPLTNGSIQRVHRSIAFQPHMLNVYQEDARMCKKIIYYLQNQFDRDLFGFILLDPVQFAKETGVKRSALAEYHDNPYQKHINKLTDKEIDELKAKDEYFHTIFENALFRIGNQRIVFTANNEADPTGEKSIKWFDFFDEVKIKTIKSNRNKKVYYVKPSLFFAKTLKQYTLIDPKKYFELSKKRDLQLGDLYVYLNYVKQTLIHRKEVAYTAHKNLLAKVLNCPQYKRDRKKNEIIDACLREIQTKVPKLGLMFEPKARPEKPMYKDLYLLSFNNMEASREFYYGDGKSEERTLLYFDHHLNYRLILALVDAYPSIDMTDFYFHEIFSDWLASERDLPIKYKAYQEAYKDLFNAVPAERYYEAYFRDFRHLSGEFHKRYI